MSDKTHQSPTYKVRKTIALSPEAARLMLPIRAHNYELTDAGGAIIGSIDHYGDNALDAELAAFIAALVNEALTPPAPATDPKPRRTFAPAAIAEIRQLLLEATGAVAVAYGIDPETYQVGHSMPFAVRSFAIRAAAMIEVLDANPGITIEPESNLELGQLITNEFEAAEQPVRMCANVDCLNAADPTTPSGAFCIACDVALRAELGVTPRWTGEQIIQREG